MTNNMITKEKVYDWIVNAIYEKTRQYSDNIIHVSEVSGCLRKAYYIRKYGQDIIPKYAVLMSYGNGIHELLQNYLIKKGWRIEYPVSRQFKYLRLVGHIDLYEPRQNIVVEIKTTSKIPREPYTEHVRQINTYAYLLGTMPTLYLIYIDRMGDIKVFNIPRNYELWKDMIKRAYYLYYSIRDNKEPRREKNHLCEYCPFKDKCLYPYSRHTTKKEKKEELIPELEDYNDFIMT